MPKTIDNDLAVTDCCPGFGSAAKYTAVSVRECALDVAAMADTSTKVFVYEAMGRHAGWLAAAAGLAGRTAGRGAAPDPVPRARLRRGGLPRRGRARWWRASATASSWPARASATPTAGFVADAGGGKDAFGHTQLGGVSSFLAGRVKDELGLKVHWTLPDYLQRSARHLASAHRPRAGAGGRRGRGRLRAGGHERDDAGDPPQARARPTAGRSTPAPLAKIANKEKKLPASFIRADGYGITPPPGATSSR